MQKPAESEKHERKFAIEQSKSISIRGSTKSDLTRKRKKYSPHAYVCLYGNEKA